MGMDGGGMGGGMGMGGGGEGDERMDGGMGMGMGMGGSVGDGASPLKLKDSSPWDVTVEVYGMVMLYNPVEISKIESKLNLPEPPADGGPIPTEAG